MTRRRVRQQATPSDTRRRRASGITLVEMLAYIAILGLLVNLGAKTFLSHTRLSAIGVAGLANFDALQDIRRDFTDTVQASLGVCPGIGVYRSNKEQLVLRMPTEPGEAVAARYAVFGRMENPPYLYRLIMTQDASGALQTEHMGRYRRDLATVWFAYGGSEEALGAHDVTQADLVALNVEPARQTRGNKPATIHRFTAAIRKTVRGESP
jgi:type II secretory pathway pseudopilin PulG